MFAWFSERAAYLGTLLAIKAGCLAAKVLPRGWLYRLADLLAYVGFYFCRGFRKKSAKNLGMAFGDKLNGSRLQEIVCRSLQNFFRDFVEVALALVAPVETLRAEIPIIGRSHLDAALAKGNGVIALSAHLGNFFLLGTRLATESYPIHVLVNPPRDRQFAQVMDEYRLQVRQQTIHARPRRDALRELARVLRRNQIAVVIADEYRNGKGIHVPFFGRTVLARRGPASIALRTGAAVVPACLVRDDKGSLKLIIEPELELVRSGKSRTAIRENTLLMTQWLEKTVRAYPEQWNWMNIHWQDGADSARIADSQQVEETRGQLKAKRQGHGHRAFRKGISLR
jgi:KDO2-lipid IV(A) lauroyltransferase